MFRDCKRAYFETHEKFFLRIVLLLVVALLVSACSGSQESTPTQPDVQKSEEIPVDTPILLSPTETPTQPPTELVLVTSGEFAPQLADKIKRLSDAAGFIFRSIDNWDAAEIKPNVKRVVVLGENPGVKDAVIDFPQVRFLFVGVSGVDSTDMVSVVGDGLGRPDQQGFVAGYMAAVLSQDWRVGVISRGDNASGKAAILGFQNGVIFYCGLCRPVYPPYVQYPVFAELQENASEEGQAAAVDVMASNAVQIVYVAPETGDEKLFNYLHQKGILIIGSGEPLPELTSSWIASVKIDWESAIESAWEGFIQGSPGVKLEPEIVISYRNGNLFSIGRQNLVDKILQELLEGFIDTGVNPLTGEPSQ